MAYGFNDDKSKVNVPQYIDFTKINDMRQTTLNPVGGDTPVIYTVQSDCLLYIHYNGEGSSYHGITVQAYRNSEDYFELFNMDIPQSNNNIDFGFTPMKAGTKLGIYAHGFVTSSTIKIIEWT